MATILMGPRADERRRLASPYLARESHLLNESVKQEQRDRVLRHFMDGVPANKKMRVFSMPSAHWTFEHQLLDARAANSTAFVCVERNWATLQESLIYMPGNARYRVEARIKGKCRPYLMGYRTSNASLFWAWAGTFVESRGTKSARWRENYRNWSAAWFDFTSPLCAEVASAAKGVGYCINPSRREVPVAFTVMAAREQAGFGRQITALSRGCTDPIERRALAIAAIVDLCPHVYMRIDACHGYKSVGGAPMALILGTLVQKESA